MSDDMRSVRPLPETDWNNVVRLLAEYFNLRGEHQRVLAELEALRTKESEIRAKWQSVPLFLLRRIMYQCGMTASEQADLRMWLDSIPPERIEP